VGEIDGSRDSYFNVERRLAGAKHGFSGILNQLLYPLGENPLDFSGGIAACFDMTIMSCLQSNGGDTYVLALVKLRNPLGVVEGATAVTRTSGQHDQDHG
jgi:hypothetical protein